MGDFLFTISPSFYTYFGSPDGFFSIYLGWGIRTLYISDYRMYLHSILVGTTDH